MTFFWIAKGKRAISLPVIAVRDAAFKAGIGLRHRAQWTIHSPRVLDTWQRSQLLKQTTFHMLGTDGGGVATEGSPFVSFDIFDTLITRCWFRPTDLFVEVGRRLRERGLVAISAESWAEERIRVEAELRTGPVEEVTLGEIYEALGERMHWNRDQLARVRELELGCELEAVRPIAVNIDCCNCLRATGTEVILVSDTYFDKPTIMTMLRRCGVEIEQERVYISSALGASKRTGRLFEHVTRSHAAAAVTHIGDNVKSDIFAAAAAGVNPIYFADSQANRYEDAFDHFADYPIAMRSALAGNARATRLQNRYIDDHLKAVWDTAADVAGPLLFGFVLWLLSEAKRRGIHHLYFVARDGQILLRIAKTIVAKMAWPVECNYLYGSRQAWHLPALQVFDKASLDWILTDHCPTSIRDHLAKVELTPEACSEALARHGFLSDSWGRELSEEQRKRLRQTLEDLQLQEMMLARASECRGVTVDYLQAAGVFNHDTIAIVDIGWHGTLQSSLSKLMHASVPQGRGKLTGFYLGLVSRPEPAAGELHSFLDDAKPRLPPRLVNPTLLEVFCAADHGSVRGYRRASGGDVEPVLHTPGNDLALQWGLGAQQEAIETFSATMIDAIVASDVALEHWVAFLRAAAVRALSLFTRTPSPEEADAFGRFQHATHQTHAKATELAPRLPLTQRWLAAAIPLSVRYQGFWFEGSIRRSVNRRVVERAPFKLFCLRRAVLNMVLRARGLKRSHA
jgi:predicted HAD superfamily hydrolase